MLQTRKSPMADFSCFKTTRRKYKRMRSIPYHCPVCERYYIRQQKLSGMNKSVTTIDYIRREKGAEYEERPCKQPDCRPVDSQQRYNCRLTDYVLTACTALCQTRFDCAIHRDYVEPSPETEKGTRKSPLPAVNPRSSRNKPIYEI